MAGHRTPSVPRVPCPRLGWTPPLSPSNERRSIPSAACYAFTLTSSARSGHPLGVSVASRFSVAVFYFPQLGPTDCRRVSPSRKELYASLRRVLFYFVFFSGIYLLPHGSVGLGPRTHTHNSNLQLLPRCCLCCRCAPFMASGLGSSGSLYFPLILILLGRPLPIQLMEREIFSSKSKAAASHFHKAPQPIK